MAAKVLSLAKPAATILSAINAYARATEKRDVAIHSAFRMAYDMAKAADIPRDQKGHKILRAAVTESILKNDRIVNAILGSDMKPSTLAQYASGLYRAYIAGVEWSPRAHNSPDNGGAPQFPWKAKAAEPTDADAADGESGEGLADSKAEAAKPSKVEAVTIDLVRSEGVQFLTHLRMLGLADVAEKVLDAMINSPLKPTPPAK